MDIYQLKNTKFVLQIMLCLFSLGSVCNVEMNHISQWIQTDSKYPWNVYIFETFMNKDLNQCVECCKARKSCEYINFKIRAAVCYLIGVNVVEGDIPIGIDERIQTKKGYVFGKKQEWAMDSYQVCNVCQPQGDCKQEGQLEDKFAICKSSGCRPPENKAGTVLLGNMWSVGGKIEYHCKVGFTDVARSTGSATCQISGNWSSTSIRCVPDAAVPNFFMDSYYLFEANIKQNWKDAKAYCEDLGGHLADIKTSDEMEYVTTLFEIYPYAWSWLGANDRANDGSWIWSDGTSVDESYNAWWLGEPSDNENHSCMVTHTVSFNGSEHRVWAAKSCGSILRSICEF